MAKKSELIRQDIERTRAQLGDTLDALSYKINVPARAKGWFVRKKDAVAGAAGSAASKVKASKVAGTTPSTGETQDASGGAEDTVERGSSPI